MGKDGTFSADWTGGDAARITHGSGCLCGISRRKFLAGAAAAGAAALTPRQAPAQAKPQRIDVHHHMLPPKYVGEAPRRRRHAGLDRRRTMDAAALARAARQERHRRPRCCRSRSPG